MRFSVTSATAGNDFRYLISSGLNMPPPLAIVIPSLLLKRWGAHPNCGARTMVRDINTYYSDSFNPY